VTDSEPCYDGTPGGLDAVEPDELGHLLTIDCHRQILSTLMKHGPEMSLAELVDQMTARERRAECDLTLPGSSERLEIALHHVYLSQLHEAKVVAYDPERTTVEVLVDPGRLARLLRVLQGANGSDAVDSGPTATPRYRSFEEPRP
jgi:acetolactate synthase small subunit